MRTQVLTVTPRDKHLPVYLCTVGHTYQPPMKYPNGSPHYHWLHTVSGAGIVEFQGESRILSAGKGFLMYPKMPCQYWPEEDPWEVMWVTFDGKNLNQFLEAWGMSPGFIDLVDLPYINSRITDLLTISPGHSDYASAILSSLLYAFLIDLGWQTFRDEHTTQQRKKLMPALRLIGQYYCRPISVADLAEQCGVTTQHLCRMFRSVFGVTPVSYLTTYRVSKAKELLLEYPDLSVAEIAALTGFSSLSYFCTVFRRYEKTTPTDFRRMNMQIGDF